MRSSWSGFTRRAVVNLCPLISQIWTQLHPLLPICAPRCSNASGISFLNFKTLSKKARILNFLHALRDICWIKNPRGWRQFDAFGVLLVLTRGDAVCETRVSSSLQCARFRRVNTFIAPTLFFISASSVQDLFGCSSVKLSHVQSLLWWCYLRVSLLGSLKTFFF